MNWRRKNMVKGLWIDGVWVEKVNKIKMEAMRFFEEKFKEVMMTRLRLDGINFKTLALEDNSFLIAPLDEKEVKEAI